MSNCLYLQEEVWKWCISGFCFCFSLKWCKSCAFCGGGCTIYGWEGGFFIGAQTQAWPGFFTLLKASPAPAFQKRGVFFFLFLFLGWGVGWGEINLNRAASKFLNVLVKKEYMISYNFIYFFQLWISGQKDRRISFMLWGKNQLYDWGSFQYTGNGGQEKPAFLQVKHHLEVSAHALLYGQTNSVENYQFTSLWLYEL